MSPLAAVHNSTINATSTAAGKLLSCCRRPLDCWIDSSCSAQNLDCLQHATAHRLRTTGTTACTRPGCDAFGRASHASSLCRVCFTDTAAPPTSFHQTLLPSATVHYCGSGSDSPSLLQLTVQETLCTRCTLLCYDFLCRHALIDSVFPAQQ